MIEYSNRTFSNLFDRGNALRLDAMRFVDCVFENSSLSLTKNIDQRSIVTDVELVRCSSNGCDLGPAILKNVSIDSLAVNDLLIIWGALFDRVSFSGSMGKLKINHHVHHVDRSESTQKPFDDFRGKFYESIEWAIDIKQARFKGFDVRGIPARLFRRDPETQVVVTRDRAMTPGWREALSPTNTLWPFMIKLFLADGDQDMVLVAPLGAPKAKRDLLISGLNELRELGVAEPN